MVEVPKDQHIRETEKRQEVRLINRDKGTETEINMTQKGRWGDKGKQSNMSGTQFGSGDSGRRRQMEALHGRP